MTEHHHSLTSELDDVDVGVEEGFDRPVSATSELDDVDVGVEEGFDRPVSACGRRPIRWGCGRRPAW